MNLVRSELLKIRTTATWWLFGIGALVTLALAFLVNAINANFSMTGGQDLEGVSPEQAETIRATANEVYQAANLFTSGQYFGLLFVLLLGILVVTNEFYHQTATTTFLTTPRRTMVVGAKLVTAAIFGAVLWLITTVLTVPATLIFFSVKGWDPHLGSWDVTRAILLNLLAYVLWGILGVGFGVLIRSQIGATITAVVLYLVGTTAANLVFFLLQQWLEQDWISKLAVVVPSTASQLMISGTELPGNPPQWVGAAVLIGYSVVTAAVGTAIMRRRDIA
ncbi:MULTISPECIES: ABC transporter permease subunit [unclassified Micromonospora]|uniref:ABC transporter permease subunit n=1 Tax=unclassified Micromonospora TaxID=2617518 RepID=UPI0013D82D89|nr:MULTISPECIES: ABC transporter permease subunit [unclassified Micromonospora]NES15839.1 ABC transporter permease subunit [Micromonospora sp. PPF5-17B]NES57262.1 ABC transporter permease subunit [Micromonospora sp. PPF5-6]